MKAYSVSRYGKAGAGFSDVPEPQPGEDDVLVEVHAAGMNPLDPKIRDGDFKLILPYRLPQTLGNEFAGTVLRAGPKVTRFRAGDEVYGRPAKDRIGSFAERIAVREGDLAVKPKNLSMQQAASLPLVALTSWQALVEHGQLKRGQKVLIHAGAGGVGTFAIQLAKHLGATVATTTSTANIDLVKGLGADIVIDYRKDSFDTMLHGYDLVLHSLDPATLAKSFTVLKPGGKLVSISGPPDAAFAREAGMNWALQQVMRLLSHGARKRAARQQVDYSFLFMRADGAQLAGMTPLFESGAIQPVIDRVFPFDALPDAMAYQEQGRAKGKVVVDVLTSR